MKKINKIAIQGLEGSYSHQAVKEIFEKNKEDYILIENDTFHQAFQSIKKYSYGLIPVENSTAGFIDATIDEMVSGDFEIIGEYFLKINHRVLAKKGTNLKKIKKVYSHYQGILQISEFLKKEDIQGIDYGDTAGGAKFVSENKDDGIAAIGPEILEEIYNLEIIASNINNEVENTTRFLLIKKKGVRGLNFNKGKDKKSALIFKTRNIPGALYKALGGFATNNIDLLKIISRPIKNKRFGYLFYLEFEGDKDNKLVKNALEELNFFSEEITHLGSFKKL